MKRAVLLLLLMTLFAGSAQALPALQLGPGAGNWTYDNATQTWVTDENPFTVKAYANDDPGNGAYAWDPAGAGTQTAYLVVASVPDLGNLDVFDITVENDGGTLSLYTSGYGTPPLNDPNSIAPHGIFDTYFEIYEFNFDGASMTINDTQPGSSGSGPGFMEALSITINSRHDDLVSIHMDLFTVKDDGILNLGAPDDNSIVNAVAPFSHDAQFDVPEPGSLLLLSLGIAGVGYVKRRRRS